MLPATCKNCAIGKRTNIEENNICFTIQRSEEKVRFCKKNPTA